MNSLAALSVRRYLRSFFVPVIFFPSVTRHHATRFAEFFGITTSFSSNLTMLIPEVFAAIG